MPYSQGTRQDPGPRKTTIANVTTLYYIMGVPPGPRPQCVRNLYPALTCKPDPVPESRCPKGAWRGSIGAATNLSMPPLAFASLVNQFFGDGCRAITVKRGVCRVAYKSATRVPTPSANAFGEKKAAPFHSTPGGPKNGGAATQKLRGKRPNNPLTQRPIDAPKAVIQHRARAGCRALA